MVDAQGRVSTFNQRVCELLDLPTELLATHPTLADLARFQWQRGDLDNPQLHIWDSKRNSWEDLTTLNCKVFDTYSVTKGEIKLACQSDTEVDKKGKIKVEAKSFNFKEIKETNMKNLPYEKVHVVGALENELKISLKKPPQEVSLQAAKLF